MSLKRTSLVPHMTGLPLVVIGGMASTASLASVFADEGFAVPDPGVSIV